MENRTPNAVLILPSDKIKIMTTINPWINFNGNAEDAFNFYKSVFGGEFTNIIRFKDTTTPEYPVADNDANKIMRIVLPIGEGGMLIGNDVPEFMGKVKEDENRSKIHVGVRSTEEAVRIFVGLSEGGNVEVPMDEDFAMFRDKYGIEWIVEVNPDN
jgi:PhnB protein